MPSIEPERPRAEPEIIPPDRIAEEERRRAARVNAYASAHESAYQRIYVGRIGPFGMMLVALLGAALAVLIVALLIGAFLIAIPIAALVVAGTLIAGLFRSVLRRR